MTQEQLGWYVFPSNAESVQQAESIPDICYTFAKDKNIRAYALSDMKNIYENTSEVYMLSCPKDEYSGCTMVVAENSGVPYAVTGRVTALDSGMRVEVHFIDTIAAKEQLVVSLDVGEQGEKIFAETVARSLLSVMKGEISQGDDVREEEVGPEELDVEAVGELNDFTQQQGGAESIGERIELEVEEKGLTKVDIYLMMEEEGMKEWTDSKCFPWSISNTIIQVLLWENGESVPVEERVKLWFVDLLGQENFLSVENTMVVSLRKNTWKIKRSTHGKP